MKTFLMFNTIQTNEIFIFKSRDIVATVILFFFYFYTLNSSCRLNVIVGCSKEEQKWWLTARGNTHLIIHKHKLYRFQISNKTRRNGVLHLTQVPQLNAQKFLCGKILRKNNDPSRMRFNKFLYFYCFQSSSTGSHRGSSGRQVPVYKNIAFTLKRGVIGF